MEQPATRRRGSWECAPFAPRISCGLCPVSLSHWIESKGGSGVRKTGDVIRYQAPPFIWAGLIFLSSSIPASAYPEVSIAGLDKVVHLAIYGVLCFLTYNAIRHQTRFPRFSRHAFTVSVLLTVCFGAVDELHQLLVPGRSADVFDLMADFVGSVLFVLAGSSSSTRTSSSTSSPRWNRRSAASTSRTSRRRSASTSSASCASG